MQIKKVKECLLSDSTLNMNIKDEKGNTALYYLSRSNMGHEIYRLLKLYISNDPWKF